MRPLCSHGGNSPLHVSCILNLIVLRIPLNILVSTLILIQGHIPASPQGLWMLRRVVSGCPQPLLCHIIPSRIRASRSSVRTCSLSPQDVGQKLELTSHLFPENGFVGIWCPLMAWLLPLPRFVHDPSTQTTPFQRTTGWLSPFQDPSLHYGSTHDFHTPLLLEELSDRYSPSSPSVWPKISFVKPSPVPV